MQIRKQADVMILGAGPVGLSMALALSKEPTLRVLLVDAADPQEFLKAQSDGRTTAIAYGSSLILEDLGVWAQLLPEAEPIQDIYVTTQNSKAYLHYESPQEPAHPLGYILDNVYFRRVLFEAVQQRQNIQILAPLHLESLEVQQNAVYLKDNHDTVYTVSLCIAADGRNSWARRQVQDKTWSLPYHQKAIVCTVHHPEHHQGRAFEHFLPSGPLAFLPMKGGHHSSVVWSLREDACDNMMALADADFMAAMGVYFEDVLGPLTLEGKRWVYPLSASVARNYVYKRMAFIGDAAHVMHPVAGQGFNLGLRDVELLGKMLCRNAHIGVEMGDFHTLQAYQRKRYADVHSMVGFTDGLVRIFSNNIPLLRRLRPMALGVCQRLPFLKKMLAERAMGLF